MPDASALLERLRDDPAHVEALVDLALDAVLATPARALIDAEALAGPLAAGLRASAASPGLTPWIERAVREALGRVQAHERPLREALPPALPGALANAARRPFTPGRELVRAALNHATMRAMVRSVLQATLMDFAKKVWSAVPDTSWIPGAGLRSKLVGVAKGVASAVGSDSMLEEKVRSFVDGALASAIEMVVEQASDPRYAKEMAQWRADVVPALLAQPQARLVAEVRKVAPEGVAADAAAIVGAFAAWEGLEAAIAARLGEAAELVGEQSVGEVLAGSGLVEAWRPLARERLAAQARAIVAGEAFAGWLARLCAG